MSEPSPAQPAVVVIGGGYGGINVAKSLDDVASVVLVEPKDAFVHNVAALRALVDPSWLPRIYLPYGRLLSRGRVVHDRAAKVDTGRVVLASGDELPADYIVLGPGFTYPFPAKSDVDAAAAAMPMRAAHAAPPPPLPACCCRATGGYRAADEIKAVCRASTSHCSMRLMTYWGPVPTELEWSCGAACHRRSLALAARCGRACQPRPVNCERSP
jgi:hypothetical protein